jgi:hypothetical protein
MSTTNSKEQHTKSLATLQLEYHRKQEARKKGTQTGSAAASSEASNTQAGTGVPLTAAPTLASLGVKTAPDERPVEVHEGDMEFWNKRLGQSSSEFDFLRLS